ncbi:MAG: ComEC/Rec2 family competence protein [Gammaproteobacteria bacterium]|nr:ComEC/Rec2 family competence protein [Gammaproteobacteria bacterium]
MFKIIIFIILTSALFFRGAFKVPPQLPEQTLLTTGIISSIPEYQQHALQFVFIPDHTSQKIFLRWYYPPPAQLHIGDQWMLNISIKPAWQHWLLTQHMNAIGTVKFNYNNQLLLNNQAKILDYPLQKIRESIYTHLKETLHNKTGLGFISALTIGMRDQITQAQWDDLRGTGTNHLMAIAGLHIGFVFGFIFFLSNKLWRFSEKFMLWVPAQEAGLFIGLSGALLYAALSGFAIPAKRAAIMLSIFVLTQLSRRHINIFFSYFMAIMGVIIIDPLSIFTPTFWLSFIAVFLLIYGLAGRTGKLSFWEHWTHAQWIMAVGLIPVNLLFFEQISWIGFIANAIAIPFVGFVILPLCLTGIVFHSLWTVAEFLLMHFWIIMHGLAQLPHTQHYQIISISEFFRCSVGVLLVLSPRGFPGQFLGWIWLISIFR